MRLFVVYDAYCDHHKNDDDGFVQVGDRIQIMRETPDEGWVVGQLLGRLGAVPLTHLSNNIVRRGSESKSGTMTTVQVHIHIHADIVCLFLLTLCIPASTCLCLVSLFRRRRPKASPSRQSRPECSRWMCLRDGTTRRESRTSCRSGKETSSAYLSPSRTRAGLWLRRMVSTHARARDMGLLNRKVGVVFDPHSC